MSVRFAATAVAAALVVGLFFGANAPALAAIPANVSLGKIAPTPSSRIMTKHRDGDDGTTAIPLLCGACPPVNLTVGASCVVNLRTACGLVEPGSPAASVSVVSGTLPAGCTAADDGFTGAEVTAAASSNIALRWTRNTDTVDCSPFQVAATDPGAGTDLAAPTLPLSLAATDNADGTAALSWLPSGDPNVDGVVTGVTSYQVKLDGAAIATVSAPSANIQPALTAYEVDEPATEPAGSSSQSGADWTLTYGGAGLQNTADQIYGRWALITGDYVATLKATSYTPTSGTSGSVGLAARASNSADGAIAVYSRWRDSDDKCNQRYRTTTGGAAANGTLSTSAYTAPWIQQVRAGDLFSTYCSSDGGLTWAMTSSQTVASGAAVYVGPFVTSGSAGNAATAVVDDFAVTQGGVVTYTYTGAGGTFAVNAYDGANRSADGASVAQTVTGYQGGGGGASDDAVTVPGSPTGSGIKVTVCTSGCDYRPEHLQTMVASASAAAANGIVPGSIIELRTMTAGGHEMWTGSGAGAPRLYANGVDGTADHPIWVVIRAGDKITFAPTTNPGQGILHGTNSSYWNLVGDASGGWEGGELGDPLDYIDKLACHQGLADTARINDSVKCFPHDKSFVFDGDSSHIALVGWKVHGANAYGAVTVTKTTGRFLFKNIELSYHGHNVRDQCSGGSYNADGGEDLQPGDESDWCDNNVIDAVGNTGWQALKPFNDADGGEIFNICADRVVYQNVYLHHATGHKPMQPCGPRQVYRRLVSDGNMADLSLYPMFTGNHAATFINSLYSVSEWTTTPFGPLVEDSLFYGMGSEPEHKTFQESIQIHGNNVILRRNYVAQRAGVNHWEYIGPRAFTTCGSVKTLPANAVARERDLHLYNNTVWGGGAFSVSSPTGFAIQPFTDPDWCSGTIIKNNLFQGMQPASPSGQNLGSRTYNAYIHNPGGFGSYNVFKGAQIFGNVFGQHPTDLPSAALYKLRVGGYGQSTSELDFVRWASGAWTGNGIPNGDWDCTDGGDSGSFPLNWCGNLDERLAWADGTADPLDLTGAADMSVDRATLRAKLTLQGPTGTGIGDAWPMTYVASDDAGSGTTLKLDSVRWIYDGWGNQDYDWGGLHQEHPDCIAIGATPASTAQQATVVKVSAVATTTLALENGAQMPRLTNPVTLATGVTRQAGSPVWPATVNANGTCGAVMDNRGAAQ